MCPDYEGIETYQTDQASTQRALSLDMCPDFEGIETTVAHTLRCSRLTVWICAPTLRGLKLDLRAFPLGVIPTGLDMCPDFEGIETSKFQFFSIYRYLSGYVPRLWGDWNQPKPAVKYNVLFASGYVPRLWGDWNNHFILSIILIKVWICAPTLRGLKRSIAW